MKDQKRRSSAKSEKNSFSPILKNSLKGCGIGILVSLLLLLIMAFAAVRTRDPASLVPILSYITLLVCSFAAGIASAKLNKHDGMLCGMLSGAIFFSVIFICSLFVEDNENTNYLISVILRLASVPCALLGGMLADKKSSGRAKRKRKKMPH